MRSGILFLTSVLMFVSISSVKSQEVKEEIVYKYKEREKIDLGDLEIKGNIIAPGDITIMERDRKRFSRPLYNKSEFDTEIRQTVLNFR